MPSSENTECRETPPAGYDFVRSGEIRVGDQVWDDSDQEWSAVGPEEIGDDAEGYFAIARKTAQN